MTAHASDLLARYAQLAADGAPEATTFRLAGRLLGLRKMGKGALWADL